MSKLNMMAAILKFINGRNNNRGDLSDIINYTTDPAKTEGGKLVSTLGCSRSDPVRDIENNKMAWHKEGKQYEHFVLAFPPNGNQHTAEEILRITSEIVETVYADFMAVISVHTDSLILHSHVVLDSLNAVTGKKFSQGPGDLNRVKQKTNSILKAHGFEIIQASANDFVDHTDYSHVKGFGFLELDEGAFFEGDELITEADLSEIITPGDLLTADEFFEVSRRLHNYRVNPFRAFGGRNSMQICKKNELRVPVQDVQITPATSAPLYASDNVSTATGTTNPFPTTTVATGPVFHIRGGANSDLSALSDLALNTAAYAQEHRVENANLALALQSRAQASGLQTNVTVFSGPILDIDLGSGTNTRQIVLGTNGIEPYEDDD